MNIEEIKKLSREADAIMEECGVGANETTAQVVAALIIRDAIHDILPSLKLMADIMRARR